MKDHNSNAPRADQAIRGIPFNQLVLAPENVRRTSADKAFRAELIASIRAHGLLENLVVRVQEAESDSTVRFAVIAGHRRLEEINTVIADGTLNEAVS